jgi:hypothetical protein
MTNSELSPSDAIDLIDALLRMRDATEYATDDARIINALESDDPRDALLSLARDDAERAIISAIIDQID